MMASVALWWQQREPRERIILICGAAIALLILLFAMLWPLYERIAATQSRIARKSMDLQYISSVAPQLLAAGAPTGSPATRETVLVVIDSTARESGLSKSLGSVEPVGDGEFRASLTGAPFDAVVAWLARLRQQHGVSVSGASFSPASGVGLVNASLQLKPARN
jgi:general secretion pathway protein M